MKRNRKGIWLGAAALAVVLAALLILLPRGKKPVAEGNLLTNGDFSQLEADGLPTGWYTDDYVRTPGYTDYSAADGVVTIVNHDRNDARFAQAVDVEPDSYYVLRGEIQAQADQGLGANLSIADVYVFSPSVYDTKGQWETVELYGHTGKKQTQVTVFVRLGGYSGEAVGTASFRNITLEQVASVPAGQYAADWYKDTAPAKSDSPSPAWPWLLAVALAYAGVCLLLRQAVLGSEKNARRGWGAAACMLALALAARVAVALLIPGYAVDIGCFTYWGDFMAHTGAADRCGRGGGAVWLWPPQDGPAPFLCPGRALRLQSPDLCRRGGLGPGGQRDDAVSAAHGDLRHPKQLAGRPAPVHGGGAHEAPGPHVRPPGAAGAHLCAGQARKQAPVYPRRPGAPPGRRRGPGCGAALLAQHGQQRGTVDRQPVQQHHGLLRPGHGERLQPVFPVWQKLDPGAGFRSLLHPPVRHGPAAGRLSGGRLAGGLAAPEGAAAVQPVRGGLRPGAGVRPAHDVQRPGHRGHRAVCGAVRRPVRQGGGYPPSAAAGGPAADIALQSGRHDARALSLCRCAAAGPGLRPGTGSAGVSAVHPGLCGGVPQRVPGAGPWHPHRRGGGPSPRPGVRHRKRQRSAGILPVRPGLRRDRLCGVYGVLPVPAGSSVRDDRARR